MMQPQAGKIKKRGTFRKHVLPRYQLYLLLAIPLLYLLLFDYIPMLGAQIAFKRFNFRLGIWGSPWVGFKHFVDFFESYQFGQIMRNTVFLSLYGLLATFPLPIILALLINAFPGRRYAKFVQTISYMPHFISTVVFVGMLLRLFNPRTGAIGVIYSILTGGTMNDLLAQPGVFSHMYVWSGVWQGLGWSSIIYIAALSGVDPALHEAAEIDGANRLQRMIHIDLPSIRHTITMLLILSAGRVMSVGFEKVYLMQNSLNISASEVISTYVYKVGMSTTISNYAPATAIGLFNSVVNFSMLALVNWIARKVSSNSLW